MSAEQLQVKLGVSGVFWDRRPEYRVLFNGTPVAHQHITTDSGITEYLEFVAEYDKDSATISVELLNKRPTDTVENADKTGILKDMTLNIDSLEIDDIGLDTLLHRLSEYRPDYPNHYQGEPVLRDCVTLGWNGTWSITWSNPFYLWLLENL